MSKKPYTEEQIVFIQEQYLINGPEWLEIAEKFNKKYNDERSAVGIERAHQRYGGDHIEDTKNIVKQLKQTARSRKSASAVRKENSLLLEHLSIIDDAKDAVTSIIRDAKLPQVKIPKPPKKSKAKKDLCKEILLSDLHYGKLVYAVDGEHISFNAEIARKRMRYLADIFIREIEDSQKSFNVTKLVVALMGDIIESYTMHGLESAKGCEFNNSEQMRIATQSLFEDFIVPVAKLGIPITIPCIPGNHDRTSKEKTYNQIGVDYVTHVIYHTLEQYCKYSGITNVEFVITKQSYVVLDIFGDKILYHHGDLAFRGTGHQKLKNFRKDVEEQVGFKIRGSRSGHTHEYVVYGRGEDIVNGCLVGQDDYAHNKGYSTEASQTINDYVDTKKERTKFYKSFAVSLESVK